jgi:quinol monooxygenase YgiN
VRTNEHENAIAFIKSVMIEPTRAEPGCISYRLYQDVEDENAFTLVEEWESQAVLDDHFRTPHFDRLLEWIPSVVIDGPDPKFHEVAVTRGVEAIEAARA